jgi:hypothetical protein
LVRPSFAEASVGKRCWVVDDRIPSLNAASFA